MGHRNEPGAPDGARIAGPVRPVSAARRRSVKPGPEVGSTAPRTVHQESGTGGLSRITATALGATLPALGSRSQTEQSTAPTATAPDRTSGMVRL